MSLTPWRSLSVRARVTLLATVGTLLTVGVVVTVIALHIRASTRPVGGGVLTHGVIEGSREIHGRGTTYRSVVVFPARDHRRSFLGPVVQDRPEIGSTVSVSYDPADPADVHTVTYADDYLAPLGLGVALIAVAVLLAAARPIRLLLAR